MKGYQVIQKIEHMKECQAGVSEGSVNIKTGWRLTDTTHAVAWSQ